MQPLVLQPLTISVSMRSEMSMSSRWVPKNAEARGFSINGSLGRRASSGANVTRSEPRRI
jgi:hypothetical protein